MIWPLCPSPSPNRKSSNWPRAKTADKRISSPDGHSAVMPPVTVLIGDQPLLRDPEKLPPLTARGGTVVLPTPGRQRRAGSGVKRDAIPPGLHGGGAGREAGNGTQLAEA